MQNPYLLCYCEPALYVINPFEKTILLSFQKDLCNISLLEGRYAMSILNMIGISKSSSQIFVADVEKHPVFGV